MGRPAQLGMLLHALWYTDIIDCFIWTEECLNESLRNFLKTSKDYSKWEMVLVKCLLFLNDIIKSETITICKTIQSLLSEFLIVFFKF